MTIYAIQGKLLISFDAKVQEAPCVLMLTNISFGGTFLIKGSWQWARTFSSSNSETSEKRKNIHSKRKYKNNFIIFQTDVFKVTLTLANYSMYWKTVTQN